LAISDDPSALLAERPRGLAALRDALRNNVRRRKAASLAIALAIDAIAKRAARPEFGARPNLSPPKALPPRRRS